MIVTVLGSLLMLGCMPDSTDEPNEHTNIPAGSTHQVCAYDDDDMLSARTNVNTADAWLFIESMSEAPSSIDLDSLPESERITAAFAVTAFFAPSFADIFSAFNALYVCTEEEYELTQCNWELVTDTTLKVETVVGVNQNYTATVTADEGDGFETITVVEGKIGDLGNLTINFYEEGVSTITRTSTRAANGTETVTYSATETNWTATETANCSGSLEYLSTEDDETVSVDASWTYNSNATSGTLEFFKTGMEATYQLDW
jgi:hypothetical protein